MIRTGRPFPQQWRLGIAAGYVVLLGAISVLVYGAILPPADLQGLWFYAAFAGLVLGQFVNEPFFSTPSDTLANGVALALALITASGGHAAVPNDQFEAGKLVLAIYAAGLIVGAIVAILFKDHAGRRATVATATTRLLRFAGNASVVFGITLWAAAYAAFATDSSRLVVVLATWSVIFVVHPLERVAGWLRNQARVGSPSQQVTVQALHDPGLVVGTHRRLAGGQLGDQLADAAGKPFGHIADIDALGDEMRVVVSLLPTASASMGDRLTISPATESDKTIGYVSRGSRIDEIHVRSPADASRSGLREGRLLSVQLGPSQVLYQATAASVASDTESEMTRDVLDVIARKIGRWDASTSTFTPVAWLPVPGASVRLITEDAGAAFHADAIGVIPGSSYFIPVNVHRAVTHNTAVLGILGIGKTTLAFELIHRMLVAGIKVVALDITDQYPAAFLEIWPEPDQIAVRTKIETAIGATRNDGTPRGEHAGNSLEFRAVIREILGDLHSGSGRLLILNPAEFDVTRRDGGLNFSTRTFPLARMTMVEVTRVIAEELLHLAQETRAEVREDDNGELLARFCLVLEEAHSLVPEWNSAADKPEQHATNGTVRAVLQGRKFGFGCLLLTQRTANVTKSILNQCNSVFAMQIFDSTGVDFLRNYIGDTHARLLASLEPLHAVVFGRAFSTRVPLIVKLNDRGAFEAAVWAPNEGGVPRTYLASMPPIPTVSDDEGPIPVDEDPFDPSDEGPEEDWEPRDWPPENGDGGGYA